MMMARKCDKNFTAEMMLAFKITGRDATVFIHTPQVLFSTICSGLKQPLLS